MSSTCKQPLYTEFNQSIFHLSITPPYSYLLSSYLYRTMAPLSLHLYSASICTSSLPLSSYQSPTLPSFAPDLPLVSSSNPICIIFITNSALLVVSFFSSASSTPSQSRHPSFLTFSSLFVN